VRASEALQAARARIEDPRRWCQHAYAALDRMGDKALSYTTGNPAARFCAVGALLHHTGPDYGYARDYLNDAATALHENESGIASVNDRLGHAAVIEAYDVAISMALSDEAVES
jgi:hypothetical protein